jgi:large subunit ribosomal protein L15
MDISKVVGVDVGRRFKRRKGRGTGSGAGKTSSRGSKGAASRTGFGGLLHREGGQMPLIRRIPKRGFTNPFRVEYEVLNIRDILVYANEPITPELLKSHGLLKKRADRLKILGTGDLDQAIEVHAHAFSASAKEKIEKAGGTVHLLGVKKSGGTD